MSALSLHITLYSHTCLLYFVKLEVVFVLCFNTTVKINLFAHFTCVQLFSQYGQVLKIVTLTKNGRLTLLCHFSISVSGY